VAFPIQHPTRLTAGAEAPHCFNWLCAGDESPAYRPNEFFFAACKALVFGMSHLRQG